jgi:hypothetical protein
MYALIYDEHKADMPQCKVISIHNSREEAEIALEERIKRLGKTLWECNTRTVWTEAEVKPGDFIGPADYSTWRLGEETPYGELHSDSD